MNEGALNFLRGLNHGLNERWPTGIYTAEDSTNFLKVTAPTRYDGIGFDYKWVGLDARHAGLLCHPVRGAAGRLPQADVQYAVFLQ